MKQRPSIYYSVFSGLKSGIGWQAGESMSSIDVV